MKKFLFAAAASLMLLLAGCSTDTTEIEQRIDDLEQGVENLEKGTIASIQTQMAEMKAALSALDGTEKSLSGYITALQDAVNALTSKDTALENALNGLTANQTKLEADLAALKTSTSAEYADLKAWVEASFATQGQMSNVQDDLAALRELINTVSGHVFELFSTTQGLSTQMESVIAHTDELEERMKASENALANALEAITRLQQTVIAIQQQMAYMEEVLDTVANTQEQLSGYITTLQAAVDSLTKQKEAMEADISGLMQKDDALEAALASLTTTITTLQAALDALTAKQTSLEQQIQALQKSTDTAIEGAIKDIKDWVESSFATLDQLTAVQQLIADIQAEVNTVKTDISALQDRLDLAENSISALQDTVSSIQEQINTLQQQNELFTENLLACQTAIDEIRDTLLALQGEVEALKKDLAELIAAVQSVIVVPDYLDGMVKLVAKSDVTFRFEVYPLETAGNLAANGVSAFSLDYVETATRSGALNNIAISGVAFDGELLSVTFDATKLPAAVLNGEQPVNARLRISDGNVTRTSPFFGLWVPPIEAVDMGLSVMWAACNLGAGAPEESGDFFAWGETESKASFDWNNYIWSNPETTSPLTKYWRNAAMGAADNRSILALEDDAANAIWGGDWRIPSYKEWQELNDEMNCTWEWTERNGVNGFRVTSKSTGNSIFLPAAGLKYHDTLSYGNVMGYYWTSNMYWTIPQYSDYAFTTSFQGPSVHGIGASERMHGHSIRPVRGEYIHVTGITMPATLNLDAGIVDYLDYAISPAEAFEQGVTWTISNPEVIEIALYDDYPKFLTHTPGKSTITLTTVDGGFTATCEVTVKVEAVDLGLPSGTKWAPFNMGAVEPSDPGLYFAWAEPDPKEDFSSDNYKWCVGMDYSLSKYCWDSDLGTVDNRTTMTFEDDAAHVNWGGNWHVPTQNEWSELCQETYCTWDWMEIDGTNGYMVTSKINGNSIFLPVTGMSPYMYGRDNEGCYWSNELGPFTPMTAMWANFGETFHTAASTSARYQGLAIRPVESEWIHVTSIEMSETSKTIGIGETSSLTVQIWPGKAWETGLTWTSSNPSVVTVEPEYADDHFPAITGIAPGKAIITATSVDGGFTATCEVTVSVEPIDLGLPSGTKWAPFNVGALKDNEIGQYFAWGEIQQKEEYYWSTYKWCEGDMDSITKYCSYVDGLTELMPEDDAAHYLWGGNWYMPTKTQWEELMDPLNCEWTFGTHIGVKGCYVTSKHNGNSIFLPITGMKYGIYTQSEDSGYYWLDYPVDATADFGGFNESSVPGFVGGSVRSIGMPIRPVYYIK